METTSIANQSTTVPAGHSFRDWLSDLGKHIAERWTAPARAPTVPHIVDLIMATPCGDSCEVRLNPRVTRIDKMRWLLGIGVQQFGTEIDIAERPEGDEVVLKITVTSRRRKFVRPFEGEEGQANVEVVALEAA